MEDDAGAFTGAKPAILPEGCTLEPIEFLRLDNGTNRIIMRVLAAGGRDIGVRYFREWVDGGRNREWFEAGGLAFAALPANLTRELEEQRRKE